MRITGSFYLPGNSWIHRADPRVKVLFVVTFWILLLAFNNLFFLLGILLLLHALYFAARIPVEKILFIWRAFVPLNILIITIWALFHPIGDPLWTFGWIQFSYLGLLQGIVLALRIDSMAFLVFAWLYTTDPNAMVHGFVKLKMPYEWGTVITLVLSYIPSFQTLFQSISEAQQARGLRIEGSAFRRVQVMMPIFVSLVISVLRRSDQLAKALEARAFGAKGVRHTFMRDLSLQPADYIYMAIIAIATLTLLYLKFRYQLGSHPFYLLISEILPTGPHHLAT